MNLAMNLNTNLSANLPVNVTFEVTPNPATMKFIFSNQISDQTADFPNNE